MSAGRILVVDDQPQMRRFMRSTLTSAGYEIDDAKTGEEAVLKIRDFHPELVLLDINMGRTISSRNRSARRSSWPVYAPRSGEFQSLSRLPFGFA